MGAMEKGQASPRFMPRALHSYRQVGLMCTETTIQEHHVADTYF
jgi:hypothetical protein